ncbi:hypothetical protein K501DRAFT_101095 [Backusella circina FSU 941]|nr:hypothetical protein K501DRAFT_101095 [Backusella circina FSU 941]
MIDEQVKQDCLTEQYITKELERELQNAMEQERLYLQGELLLTEVNNLLNAPQYSLTDRQKTVLERINVEPLLNDTIIIQHLEQQLQSKYDAVKKYILTSHPDIKGDIIQHVRQKQDWIKKTQLQVAHRKVMMDKKISEYVTTVLEILGVTWHIIQEFKYKLRNDEDTTTLDSYYNTLSQTLLLKIKTLHVSVLLGTYDKEFIFALSSLRDILESRYSTSRQLLQQTTRQLSQYTNMDPEFHTLSQTYNTLLYKMHSTQQDIQRMTDPNPYTHSE